MIRQTGGIGAARLRGYMGRVHGFVCATGGFVVDSAALRQQDYAPVYLEVFE